jgi:hypothetical protein
MAWPQYPITMKMLELYVEAIKHISQMPACTDIKMYSIVNYMPKDQTPLVNG